LARRLTKAVSLFAFGTAVSSSGGREGVCGLHHAHIIGQLEIARKRCDSASCDAPSRSSCGLTRPQLLLGREPCLLVGKSLVCQYSVWHERLEAVCPRPADSLRSRQLAARCAIVIEGLATDSHSAVLAASYTRPNSSTYSAATSASWMMSTFSSLLSPALLVKL
jgi:hypothetical protein